MLLNASSYLTPTQFRAQPNDYDLTAYTDSQLQDLLTRASGKADAYLRRSLLTRERTVRYIGDGTNKLELRENPVLYVKRVQIVVPGTVGMWIPVDELLFDYQSGSVLKYTPMLWNGVGYFAQFPRNVPVDVTLGTGYGFTYSSPTYTTADAAGDLAAATYNIAVATATMWGQTVPLVKQVSTSDGAILCTMRPALGAYLYRGYISDATDNTTLAADAIAGATTFTLAANGFAVGDTLLFDANTANAELLVVAAVDGDTLTTSAAVYAHASGATVMEAPTQATVSNFTAYGSTAMALTFSSLDPAQGLWPDLVPIADTSAPIMPAAITEAVRLLALSMLWEQNNLANRGVNAQKSGRKEVSWRSTEGMSGKGVPLAEQQARSLLKPYSLQAIF